jgi:hypothetical protein
MIVITMIVITMIVITMIVITMVVITMVVAMFPSSGFRGNGRFDQAGLFLLATSSCKSEQRQGG